MSIDYRRQRAVADGQIRRWGQQTKLKRGDATRDCWALEVQLSATERRALKNPTNRVFLISAVGLDVPPSEKQDALLWTEEDGTQRVFRQDAPVSPLQPGGLVIYYEIQVQG